MSKALKNKVKLNELIDARDFGAKGDNVTDDTAALQSWLNYLYNNSQAGYLPRGTYRVTSLSLDFVDNRSITIRGPSRKGASIKKLGVSATPLLKITSTSASILEVKTTIQDIEFDCNSVANVDALEFDSAALVILDRVRCINGRNGINAKGVLVSTFRNIDCGGNTNGILVRKGTVGASPYANVLTISESRISGNSGWGLDIGEGTGITIEDCDVEANGTTSNTSTGGVMIRGSVSMETSYGMVFIRKLWLESNKGHSFVTEAGSGNIITMDGVHVFNQESTRAITIGAVRKFVGRNIIATSGTAEINSSAEESHVEDSWLFALVQSGAYTSYRNVKTNTGDGDRVYSKRAQFDNLYLGSPSNPPLTQYNEYSFTPTIAGSSIAGTPTYSTQLGRAVLIGKELFFEISITLSSKTGISGNIEIQGLPVASLNTSGYLHAASVGLVQGLTYSAGENELGVYGTNNGTSLFLEFIRTGTTRAPVTDADISGTFQIVLSGHYRVN